MTVKGIKKQIRIPGVTFLREVALELQRTEWLSAKEVAKLSFIVIVFAAVLGLSLHFLDLGFMRLVGLIV